MLPEMSILIPFMLAVFALSITPGPDMTFVATTSGRSGMKAGLMAALGVAVGCLVHAGLATFGITALLATLPGALTVLKIAGALYLGFMAFQMLKPAKKVEAPEAVAEPAPARRGNPFLQGLMVNLLNPKVGLFFLAFIPQFVPHEAAHPALMTMTLGVLFNLSGTAVNVTVAIVVARSAAKIAATRRVKAVLRYITGTIIGAFAVRLAASDL
ncbi:LysE family translocator [Gimibacter soli]|uniref:LysE family translocator n=1 Tax=Gimibacter soli TaxID=3024400 RepID=A0AAE9XPJ3_9PROT|nr:LysE family translocator [Gimibacter soli]WCL53872.1 LysE family translocator [Gimibacter soli]